MSLYRLYRGDLALLLADGHDPRAAHAGYTDERFRAFAKCRACLLPGLHMHTDSGRRRCHRCRAASLEHLYDRLLGINGFTTDIKSMILWASFQHPAQVFKNEAWALRVHHMTDLLMGPPWTYNPLWTTREAMQHEIRSGVTWKGKRYAVGRLSVYQDFLSLVIDFLF